MAEFVERNIEQMIPEIEELEKLEILKPKETKKLIIKRRNFEYKIAKQRKEMQDFIDYAMFDINLSELISVRRQKMMMFKNYDKIEKALHERLRFRLRRMTKLWPHYASIWKLRISFAASKHLYQEVSATYSEQIKFLGGSENVWIAWAQWEIEGRKNFDKARNILLTLAPMYHPSSFNLIKEYFRLELLYIEYVKLKSKNSNVEGLEEIVAENREKVLSAAVPQVIYENALEKFNTPEVYLEFYSIANKFPFAHKLRDRIIKDMMQNFPDDPYVWKLKAKMLLEGVVFNLEKDDENSEQESVVNKAENSLSPKEKLNSLLELYDKALAASGSSFLDIYFKDILHLLNEVWGAEDLESIIRQKLFQVFKEYSDHLSQEQYLIVYTLALNMNKKKKIKNILECGRKVHPKSSLIELYYIPYSEGNKHLKGKEELIERLSGNMAPQICSEILNGTSGKERDILYKKLFIHSDCNLSKAMRIKYLEELENIDECRKFYNQYKYMPPFAVKFHYSILKKELESPEVADIHVQKVFDTAIEQFGNSCPGLWLSYMEFERNNKRINEAAKLEEQALKALKSEHLNCFIDWKYLLQKTLSDEVCKDIFVDCPTEKNDAEDNFWTASTLPPILEEEVIRTFSVEESRKAFFSSIAKILKSGEAGPENEPNCTKLWEDILSIIHNRKISLNMKKLESTGREKQIERFAIKAKEKMQKNVVIRKDKLSDRLQHGELSEKKVSVDSEIQKLIDSSDVLKPEFMNQKQIIPYYLSKKRAKAIRKKERANDVGKGWFNMKAPEQTPEVLRDLNMIKMRGALDPKTHYKRNLPTELPKFFQMGKVVDSPADFYSSRLTNKQRKRTIAEEIMNDEQVLRYQQKAYKEIVEKKQIKRRKIETTRKALSVSKSRKKAKQ